MDRMQRAWRWFWRFEGINERFVVIFGLIFGLFFVALIPPMQGADEQGHYLRAYQLSQLNIASDYVKDSKGGIAPFLQNFPVNVGGELPDGIVNVAQYRFDQLHGYEGVDHKYIGQQKYTAVEFSDLAAIRNTGETKAAAFPNTAVYSPVAYIPDIIGMWVGRIFGATPFQLVYITRLFGLVFGVLVMAWAIRLVPFGKLPLAVIALLPMTISQMSIITADTTAIVFSFLAIALVLRYSFASRAPTTREWALLAGTFLLLGLAKPSLIPLCLIVLCLFANKHIQWRNKRTLRMIGICVALCVLPALLWNAFMKDAANFGYAQTYGGADYKGNLSFLLHHPWAYPRILYESFATQTFNLPVLSFIGNIGWQDTLPPHLFTVIGYMLLAVVFAMSAVRGKIVIPKWAKLVGLATALLIVLATATYLYLLTAAYGDKVAVGIQGRYFLPAAPLLILIFVRPKPLLTLVQERHFTTRSLLVSVFLLFSMTIVVALRYYNF